MKPDWLSILESQLASAPRGNNVYAFSTVGYDAPKVRHVVHRAATPSALLLATTDIRSAKVAQLRENPAAEAAWWFPGSNVQFRITGKAYVLPATHEENERSASRSRSSSAHSLTPMSLQVPSDKGAGTAAPLITTEDDLDALTKALDGSAIDDKEKTPPLTPISPTTRTLPRSPLSREASVSSAASNQTSSTSTSTSTESVARTPSLLGRSSSQRTNRLRPNVLALEDALAAIRAIVPSTAPESSPSWWTAERKRHWEGMGSAMRASFARPKVPGTEVEREEAEQWVKSLGKHAANDEEARTLAFAMGNFALLVLAPEKVEILELAEDPHRRTIWVRERGLEGQWEKQDIVP